MIRYTRGVYDLCRLLWSKHQQLTHFSVRGKLCQRNCFLHVISENLLGNLTFEMNTRGFVRVQQVCLWGKRESGKFLPLWQHTNSFRSLLFWGENVTPLWWNKHSKSSCYLVDSVFRRKYVVFFPVEIPKPWTGLFDGNKFVSERQKGKWNLSSFGKTQIPLMH